jgi:hypothetical protein
MPSVMSPLISGVATLTSVKPRWVSYGYWELPPHQNLKSFKSTWKIPSAPAETALPYRQTLFLFNGIQNDPRTGVLSILQPVLIWGNIFDQGGAYWSIGCFYATDAGFVSYTDFKKVDSNVTELHALITRSYLDKTDCYTCEFVGHPGTKLNLYGGQRMNWLFNAFEAYDTEKREHYPSSVSTIFSNQVEGEQGLLPSQWRTESPKPDFGAKSTPLPDGGIEIYYGK